MGDITIEIHVHDDSELRAGDRKDDTASLTTEQSRRLDEMMLCAAYRLGSETPVPSIESDEAGLRRSWERASDNARCVARNLARALQQIRLKRIAGEVQNG